MTAARLDTFPDSRPVPDPTVLTTQQLTTAMVSLKELFAARIDAMDKAVGLLQDIANRSPSISEVYLQHEERFKAVVQQFAERDERFKTSHEAQQLAIEVAIKTASGALMAGVAKIDNLQELHDEKFRSIAVQFAERDIRTEQTSRDSKVAVDAALQAAKEAVLEQNKSSALAIAKSEASTMKQIDQIGVIMQSMTAGTNDKIDDIKERLTSMEGKSSVSDPAIGTAVQALVAAVGELKTGANRGEGHAQGATAIWGFIVAGVGVLVGIAALAAAFRPH